MDGRKAVPNFSQVYQRVFAISAKTLGGLHQPPVPARVNPRLVRLFPVPACREGSVSAPPRSRDLRKLPADFQNSNDVQ